MLLLLLRGCFTLTFLELENVFRSEEHGSNKEVGDLPDKSIDVIDAFTHAIQHSLQVKIIEIAANCLNNILQNSHAGLQTLPALRIMHRLARLIHINLLLYLVDVTGGICPAIWLPVKGVLNILQHLVLQPIEVLDALVLVLENHFSQQRSHLVPHPKLLIRQQRIYLLDPNSVPHEVPERSVDQRLLLADLCGIEKLNQQGSSIDGAKPILPARGIEHEPADVDEHLPRVPLEISGVARGLVGDLRQDARVEDFEGLLAVEVEAVAEFYSLIYKLLKQARVCHIFKNLFFWL